MPENVVLLADPDSLAVRYGFGDDTSVQYGPEDPVLRKLAQCPTVEVYEQMRPLLPAASGAWSQLRNVLFARGWQVVAGEGSAGERNAEIMRAILGGVVNVDTLLEELFEALWNGYAVAAVTSLQDLTVDGRTFQAPWYVRTKTASRFGFTVDRRLALTNGAAIGGVGAENVFETNPELGKHVDQLRFLLVTLSTDDPYGSAVAIAPHVYQMFRLQRGTLKRTIDNMMRALGILVIDGPRPMLPGSGAPGYKPEDVPTLQAQLAAMVSGMNESGVLKVPPDVNAHLEKVEAFGDQAVRVLRYLDENIRAAILTVTLTASSSDQGSSRAAAQVHLGPMLAACKASGRKIAEAVNRWAYGWIENAIGASMPPEERPSFFFNLSEKTDLDLLEILLAAGLPINGASLALEAGVDLVPDEGESLVIRRSAPAAPPAAEPEPSPEPDDEEPEPDEEGDEPTE